MCIACRANGGKEDAYKIMVGKQEGKRPLGRRRCKWVENTCIKMGVKQTGWN
jgi:hypothetical protein